MVALVGRMMRLRSRLLDIRLGPGAAVISNEVKRIHLNFAVKVNDGHMGPRKFWHNYLPRLKYHNPAIPMTVERTDDQTGPAILTVYFAPQSADDSNSSAPPSSISRDQTLSQETTSEYTKTIDMKHKKDDAILKELLELTNGQPVFATEEETEQLKSLEEQRNRSEADRARQEQVMKKRKREAELLERAKKVSV